MHGIRIEPQVPLQTCEPILILNICFIQPASSVSLLLSTAKTSQSMGPNVSERKDYLSLSHSSTQDFTTQDPSIIPSGNPVFIQARPSIISNIPRAPMATVTSPAPTYLPQNNKIQKRKKAMRRPCLSRRVKRKLRKVVQVLRGAWMVNSSPKMSGIFRKISLSKIGKVGNSKSQIEVTQNLFGKHLAVRASERVSLGPCQSALRNK